MTQMVAPGAVGPCHTGTGVMRKVGPGRQAAARVLYRVLGSRFHDGTKLEVADLYHAIGFATRVPDPAVRAATARLRDGLVALRVLRVETDVLAFGEDKLTYEVPIVEVFVDGAGGDADRAALVAPPWTTVPWHLLALAEAVKASIADGAEAVIIGGGPLTASALRLQPQFDIPLVVPVIAAAQAAAREVESR